MSSAAATAVAQAATTVRAKIALLKPCIVSGLVWPVRAGLGQRGRQSNDACVWLLTRGVTQHACREIASTQHGNWLESMGSAVVSP